MNEVFIMGTIKTEIEFKFIINSKKYFSRVKFKIQTLDKQEIIVVGYNNIADFALKNLKKKDKVFINGNLNTKMEIKIKECEIIKHATECGPSLSTL